MVESSALSYEGTTLKFNEGEFTWEVAYVQDGDIVRDLYLPRPKLATREDFESWLLPLVGEHAAKELARLAIEDKPQLFVAE
jgi:hypothetical protein